jgi:hypothetical protein
LGEQDAAEEGCLSHVPLVELVKSAVVANRLKVERILDVMDVYWLTKSLCHVTFGCLESRIQKAEVSESEQLMKVGNSCMVR